MLGWGVSDFFANEASDKVGHTRAFFWSQIAGLVLMGFAAAFFGESLVGFSFSMLAIILATGVSYALGYLFFYNAFEIGNVSIVSALINLQQLFIVGISFFVFKQTLTTLQIPAIILLISGVVLVSLNLKELLSGKVSFIRGVKECVVAAVLFGVFFWPLNEYVVERVDWAMASFLIKLVAIASVYLIAMFTKKSLRLPGNLKGIKKILIVVGLLEAFAVISVSFGVAFGDLIIVGPIASALTVVTITLAMIFLKEKISKIQGVGIALTISGIILAGF